MSINFTKKEINQRIFKAIYQKLEVSCVKLSEEDIKDYKLKLIKNKDNTCKDVKPAKKKLKMNTYEINFKDPMDLTVKQFKDKTPVIETIQSPINPEETIQNQVINIRPERILQSSKNKQNTSKNNVHAKKKLKINKKTHMKSKISKRRESDKITTQQKLSLKPTKKIASTSTKDESVNISANQILNYRIMVIHPKQMMYEDMYYRYRTKFLDETFKQFLNGTEKPVDTVKLYSNEIDALELTKEAKSDNIESQFKSLLKPTKDITSTSTVKELMEIDCQESTKSEKIRNTDIQKQKDEKKNNFMNTYLKSIGVNKCNQSINSKTYLRSNLQESEFEELCKKYFCGSLINSIVIIVHLLDIILISEEYCKEKINSIEISKKISNEAEFKKQRYNAVQPYKRRMEILRINFEKQFIDVTSSLNNQPECIIVLKTFILLILMACKQFKTKKIEKCPHTILRKLKLLVLKNYKKDIMSSLNLLELVLSMEFNSSSIDIIQESWESDIGFNELLSLYSISFENCRMYFKEVINNITTDYKKKTGYLKPLVENAVKLCKNYPMSVNLPYSSTPKSSTQIHVNSDEKTQHRAITKNLNGTLPSLAQSTVPQLMTETVIPLTTTARHFETSNPSIRDYEYAEIRLHFKAKPLDQ